jgi:hypothetical protein
MSDDVLLAVKDYLSLFEQVPVSGTEDLEELVRVLDRLSLCAHRGPEGTPGDDMDPPDSRYAALRLAAERRFPSLGFYPSADPSTSYDEAEILYGDAYDDLADIASDLSEVAWRWTNVGPDDAIWYFKLLYRSHWGNHLHDLRRYLHAKMY